MAHNIVAGIREGNEYNFMLEVHCRNGILNPSGSWIDPIDDLETLTKAVRGTPKIIVINPFNFEDPKEAYKLLEPNVNGAMRVLATRSLKSVFNLSGQLYPVDLTTEHQDFTANYSRGIVGHLIRYTPVSTLSMGQMMGQCLMMWGHLNTKAQTEINAQLAEKFHTNIIDTGRQHYMVVDAQPQTK